VIFGDCPYCGASIAFPCPAETPCWGKEKCESCGREFWEHYSRIAPQSFTVEQFDARFVIDENAKKLRQRHPLPALDSFDQAILAGFMERFARLMSDELINGTGTETPTGILGKSPIQFD
jgi:hypothetical protein